MDGRTSTSLSAPVPARSSSRSITSSTRGASWLRGPAGVLHDVIVAQEHRGRGVGRLLLGATLEFLRSRGVSPDDDRDDA
ncbi:MAG TPA: GNAT family N-acetyltransferase [Pyrinomonadaceae bacterium]